MITHPDHLNTFETIAAIVTMQTIVQKPGFTPGAPLTYFNDGGRGRGGPSDFFGSEILAKSDFLGSIA